MLLWSVTNTQNSAYCGNFMLPGDVHQYRRLRCNMYEPGTPVCLIPPINLGDLLPALVTSSEARSSFLLTRQPVQSFNQSNPTPHLYSLSRLEERGTDRTGKETHSSFPSAGINIWPSTLSYWPYSHLTTALHPPHPHSFLFHEIRFTF